VAAVLGSARNKILCASSARSLKQHNAKETMVSFEDEARKAIPCEVHMISGSMDSQTSSGVFNVGNFQVRFGGAPDMKVSLILWFSRLLRSF
jgi:hypothetical protein